jgi:hypothetical protein
LILPAGDFETVGERQHGEVFPRVSGDVRINCGYFHDEVLPLVHGVKVSVASRYCPLPNSQFPIPISHVHIADIQVLTEDRRRKRRAGLTLRTRLEDDDSFLEEQESILALR